MRKLIFFVYCLFAGYYNVLSQSGSDALFNLNYIPPSPTASSIAKFGSVPVSLNSGIPKISIPIFNYSEPAGMLSLSTSLDYHAGGIRVEEIPGSAGLGWSLNMGGVVSRTCRGLPDDYENNGYLYKGNNQSPSGLEDIYVNNGYDSEQDVFTFNCNGNSGKFILSGAGVPILIGKSNIKIQVLKSSTLSGYPIKGFRIKDGKGLIYTFEAEEKTIIGLSSLLPTVVYTSSWYLTKIETPFKERRIDFYYSDTEMEYTSRKSETLRNIYVDYLIVSPYSQVNDNSQNIHTVLGKRLDSASFPNGVSINMEYAAITRCDLKGDKALAKILIKNKFITQFGFELFHSYSSGNSKFSYSPAPCNLNPTNPNQSFRLILDSICQFSGSNLLAPYKFIYNTTPLPALNSVSIDYFGFYNGNRNTTNFTVPRMLWPSGFFNEYYMLDGADRRVDTAALKAESLEKIIYPTGGFTEFIFEPNRAGDGKLIDSFLEKKELNIDDQILLNGYQVIAVNRPDSASMLTLKYGVQTWCPGLSTGCEVRLSLHEMNGTMIGSPVTFSYSEAGTYKTKDYINLANGSYKVYLNYDHPSCVCEDPMGITVAWDEFQKDTFQFAGGLRVKQIIDYDGIDHSNDNIKQYLYILENGMSSGTVSNLQKYSQHLEEHVCVSGEEPVLTRVDDFLVRNAVSNNPLSYSGGASTAYTRVEMIHGIGSRNMGKSVNYFTGFSTLLGGVSLIEDNDPPFVPSQLLDWRIGLNTKTQEFDSSGTLISQKENEFFFYEDLLDSMKNFRIVLNHISNPCYGPTYNYTSKEYNWTIGRSELVRQKETGYFLTDSSVSFTYFNYDPYTYLLKRTRSVNSLSDTLEKRIYYPKDYPLVSTWKELADSNVVEMAVGQETGLKTGADLKITSSEFITHKKVGNSVVPDKQYSAELNSSDLISSFGAFDPPNISSNSAYINPITFSFYNSEGRLVEISEQEVNTSFIWVNQSNYPIAKVLNASNDRVAFTSFEYSDYGGWSSAGGAGVTVSSLAVTGNMVYSGSIRKTFPSGNYTISVWGKGVVAVNGVAGTLVKENINQWKLYYWHLTSADSARITADSMDNVSMFPDGAEMVSFTYDELKGMTSQVDPSNKIIYYEYDSFGRLSHVLDENKNILKRVCYNYAGEEEACRLFYNEVKSQSFTRNNCGSGYLGGSYTYTVAAGTYVGSSLQEANQLALDDIAENGQAAANTSGSCTQVFSSASASGYYYNQNCSPGTAEAIYVNMSAGSFSSTVSQSAANALAVQAAQDYANIHGDCLPASFSFVGANYSSDGATVILTNTSTSAYYYLYIDPYTYDPTVLASIAPGYYDIEIISNSSFGSFSYSVGGYFGYFYGAVSLYNIYLDSSANSIQIN